MNENDTKDNESQKAYYDMLISKEQYKELVKPWYRKIKNFSFIVTSILTLISLFILYKNGLFDFKTKELEVKRENLQFEINKFSQERDSIIKYRLRLEADNKFLVAQNLQFEIANKLAFSSINKRDTLFGQILQKNISLEKRNQILEEENKSLSNRINSGSIFGANTFGQSSILTPFSSNNSSNFSILNSEAIKSPSISFSVDPDMVSRLLKNSQEGQGDKVLFPSYIYSPKTNLTPWLPSIVDTNPLKKY